jgi:hypothetical protein
MRHRSLFIFFAYRRVLVRELVKKLHGMTYGRKLRAEAMSGLHARLAPLPLPSHPHNTSLASGPPSIQHHGQQ